jgi:hypothetical protein
MNGANTGASVSKTSNRISIRYLCWFTELLEFLQISSVPVHSEELENASNGWTQGPTLIMGQMAAKY